MEQSQYIRANKGFSFLCVPREFCAAVVLLWGINPASFLYNWAIYAGVVLLWACFAAASEICCHRASLFFSFFASSFTTQRFAATGITAYAPSSTAFWITSSILSALGRH